MKKNIIWMLLVILTSGAMAQGTVINKYFDEFSDDNNFTKVAVSSKMFSMFTQMDAGSDTEQEFMEAVSKLKGLKIIMTEHNANSEELYKKACNDVNKAGYDELMVVEDPNQSMLFSIKENNGKISELIMVVGGDSKFVLLSLYGEIDLKNISRIAREMKVEGLENLGRMNNEN